MSGQKTSRDINYAHPMRMVGCTYFFESQETSEFVCHLGCYYNAAFSIPEGFEDSLKIFLRKLKHAFNSEEMATGCDPRSTHFDVHLRVKLSKPTADGSSSSSIRQKLVGSVHGRVFKHLLQELDLQRPLKLQLKINFKEPLNKTVETQHMTFISYSRDKLWPKAFRFKMDLEGDPWTLPSSQTSVYYTLTASIIACPFLPSAGLGIVPRHGNGETAVMNKEFLEDQDNCDFTFVSGNGLDEIRCHKMFLVRASPFFMSMIQTEMKEKTENKCRLHGSTKDGLVALLKFLYYRSVEDALSNSAVAFELLNLGHKYQILRLEEVMRDLLLAKPDDWWNLEVAFNLFRRARLSEDNDGWELLKRKTTEVLRIRFTELTSNSNTLLKDLKNKDPNAAKELIWLLSQKLEWNRDSLINFDWD